MALITYSNLEEVTYTTGTGSFLLEGPGRGGQGLYTRCIDLDTVEYYVAGLDSSGTPEGQWESGLGTWRTGSVLERSIIYASSSGTEKVNFVAGTKYLEVVREGSDTISNTAAQTAIDAAAAAEASALAAAASAVSAALVAPGGTFADMMALPAPENGQGYYVTSGAGLLPTWWFYSSSRLGWYPVGNRITLLGTGTPAAPIGTVLGSAGAAQRVGYVEFPAKLLKPGCELRVWSTFTKEGSTTANTVIQHRLGTANDATSPSGGSYLIPTNNPAGGVVFSPLLQFHMSSATTFLAFPSPLYVGLGNVTVIEQATNINVDSPMYFGWYTGSISASDTVKLLAYTIEIIYGV